MNVDQFLAKLEKGGPAPVYLFLGQEGYGRKLCKDALLSKALPADARQEGLTESTLEESSLSEVLDDARSLSLFARERVIWVADAEAALPRRLVSDGGTSEGEGGAESPLSVYLKTPTPGTTIVFECSRFDFTGDDKPRIDRVQKFFAAVTAVVEFRHYTPEGSRFLAQTLAKKNALQLGGAELAGLLDAVAGDASRLDAEIEKLSLYVGRERKVTEDDLRSLVPNASESTIFALVNALGRKDRSGALRSLDVLIREGEYLPLALTFLNTQFRLALAAKENKIDSTAAAQSFFTKLGVRIWRDRAEQVLATARAFSLDHLRKALGLIYETDKRFRDGYRDDRTIMEILVMALTA